MGGVVTNITAVRHRLATYDPTVVQGTVLDRAEVDRQIELYRSQDAASRGAPSSACKPKREEVILAGACIVQDGHGEAGQGDAHRERSRPAPWGCWPSVSEPEGGSPSSH
jgi:exopolyphosphatase/guanosine-5'-triphosphate,3'-diphosphate pyrophosphatase